MEDEQPYEEFNEIPRIGIHPDKKLVVLMIADLDVLFPYDLWDAAVRYVADLRNGKPKLEDGTFLRSLPRELTWEDTLPNV